MMNNSAFDLYQKLCFDIDQFELTSAELLTTLSALIWYVHPVLQRDTNEICEDIQKLLVKWENKK